ADLAVDDVAADQDLAGLDLERVQVDVPAAQARSVAVAGGDAVGADEDAATLAGGDETQHTWSDARAARDHDDVVEPADRRAACIAPRQAHDRERVDELACHA